MLCLSLLAHSMKNTVNISVEENRKNSCESETPRERHRSSRPWEKQKNQVPNGCCSYVCSTFHPDCVWKSGELCIRYLRNSSCFFFLKTIYKFWVWIQSFWKFSVIARNAYKQFAICSVFQNYLPWLLTAKHVGEGSYTVASVLPD